MKKYFDRLRLKSNTYKSITAQLEERIRSHPERIGEHAFLRIQRKEYEDSFFLHTIVFTKECGWFLLGLTAFLLFIIKPF